MTWPGALVALVVIALIIEVIKWLLIVGVILLAVRWLTGASIAIWQRDQLPCDRCGELH